MKKAYYIIGVEKFLAKRCLEIYPPEEDFFDLGKAAQNCFISIQHTGYITDADEFYDITDMLVGREGYITLSLGKCGHWKEDLIFSSSTEGMFGFIFDAHDLIEQGALLNIENVNSDYRRIIEDVIEQVGLTFPGISQEDRDDFPYLIMGALEEHDFDAPGCRQVIKEVQQKVHAVNTQKSLKGHTALTYLESAPEDGSCQLMVWKQLSITQIIGIVQQGEETYL